MRFLQHLHKILKPNTINPTKNHRRLIQIKLANSHRTFMPTNILMFDFGNILYDELIAEDHHTTVLLEHFFYYFVTESANYCYLLFGEICYLFVGFCWF